MISIISLACLVSNTPVLLMRLSFILNFLSLTFSHLFYGLTGIHWNHGLLISQWSSLLLFSKLFHVCRISIPTPTFIFPFVFLHFPKKRKILNCLNFFWLPSKKPLRLFSHYTTLSVIFLNQVRWLLLWVALWALEALFLVTFLRTYGALPLPLGWNLTFKLYVLGFWKTFQTNLIYSHILHKDGFPKT